ncbi:NACHT domain-containing protein [Streptomyces purpurascens]|uniref:NACHT domain-containing protein n=1 Tax=Streptomyces purpurascens TaxID=1924 RepID=UPI0033EC37A7
MTSWRSGPVLTFDPPRAETWGSPARQPEPGFDQAGWNVKNVINNLINVDGAPLRSAADLAAPPVPPAPANDRAFRRNLATLLLRKLTSTMDEIHWVDHRLIDLSVIVEDVDQYQTTGRRGLRRRYGRQATRPLTEVLARPQSDLVLLQGAPGAGKSVALRQQARLALEQIAAGKTPDAPLPIYVNLRELRARPNEINVTVLRRYIEQQTGPKGSPEVTAYFAHHFGEDLRERRVILLLDSFDEIPSVLGSATIQEAVNPYVQTVIELVGGGGRCVLASREYKGPSAAGWTRLKILGLSPLLQETFLRRLGLDRQGIALVQPLLTDPRHGFVTELQNPLNVKLLAAYVRTRRTLPDRPGDLFKEHVTERLCAAWAEADPAGDADGGSVAELRLTESFLERFAFQLTSTGRGLSVTEGRYLEAIAEHAGGDRALTEALTGALSRSRLLASSGEGYGKRRVFFCHRLVKEYFASRYVAEHPSALSAQDLAAHGRWRETAVTVLQDGLPEVVAPLLAELAGILERELVRYQTAQAAAERPHVPVVTELSWSSYGSLVGEERSKAPPAHTPFAWSSAGVHCLELLTTAYQGRARWPHERIQPLVESLVHAAWCHGSISDRKFAIDCLPLLPEGAREQYIDRAFAGGSYWIRTTALRDCVTLPALTDGIRLSIRRLLITMLSERSLAAESHAVDVDLRRLQTDDDLVKVRRVVSRAPVGVALVCVLHALVGVFIYPNGTWWVVRDQLLWWNAVPFFFFWWFQSTQPLSYGTGKSRARVFLERVLKRTVGLQMDALDTVVLLRTLVLLAGLQAALQFGFGIADMLRGEPLRGLIQATVYASLSVYALLWGPSVLYAVRCGRSARALRTPRLVLAVPDAMRLEGHPVHGLSVWHWIAFVVGSTWHLAKLVVITSPLWGGYLLLYHLGGRTGRLVAWALVGLITAYFPLVVVVNVVRAIRSTRRVRDAARRGSRGSLAFFDNMFSLRDGYEAAEYVRLIRGTPGLDLGTVERQTVRICIARLQGRPAPEGSDAGVPDLLREDALRALGAWRGHGGLIDELGRLDEQLRAR